MHALVHHAARRLFAISAADPPSAPASSPVFGYCIPTFGFDQSTTGNAVNVNQIQVKSQFDAQFQSAEHEISRAVSDIANAWPVILMSAGFALVFSYVWMWLTKRVAGLIIWLCILLVVVGGFFLGFSFLREAASDATKTDADPRRTQAYKVAGYIFIAATSVFVLIILGLSSQIKIAVEVVKEGSRAINDMRFIVFFPLVPLLIAGGYVVYWIYGCLFIFSVSTLEESAMPSAAQTRESTVHSWAYYGDASKEGTPIVENMGFNLSQYQLNDAFRPLAAYHVFHGIWTIQFLVYFGYFVISGAVCSWYFTLSDESGARKFGGTDGMSRAPVTASVLRTLRYHLGTIAFASLIIAVVKFIRATVKYIELKTRTNPPNYLQKAVFCLIQCCLKCIEWSETQRTQKESPRDDCLGRIHPVGSRSQNAFSLSFLPCSLPPPPSLCSSSRPSAAWTRSARMPWCGARCGAIRSCRRRARRSRSSGATWRASPRFTSSATSFSPSGRWPSPP